MYVKPMFLEEILGDNMPHNFPESVKTHELFGIEVELEGKGGISKPTDKIMEDWTVTNDGSLRKLAPGDEAIEYVTRVPRNRLRTTKSLMNLMEFLTSPGKVVYDSYRTSIHVHVNCMADKLIHVYNFITLCIIFDELLASQNGEHRIGNNFCLRARDAQGQVTDLINSINSHGSIFGLQGNWRYSAINFASLCKFGTVEFRSLECTTDLPRIIQWVQVIENMKIASRTFDNPQQIIRGFSSAFSIQDFCKMILGDMADKYIQVPGFEHMLFDGMRLAQDFAFCSKWIARKPKEAPKPKPAPNKLKLNVVDYEAVGLGNFGQWVQAGGAAGMAQAHAELNNLALGQAAQDQWAQQYFPPQGGGAPPPAPVPAEQPFPDFDDDDDDDFDDDFYEPYEDFD